MLVIVINIVRSIFKPSRKKADDSISVYLIPASLSHSVGAGLPDRQLTPLSILPLLPMAVTCPGAGS